MAAQSKSDHSDERIIRGRIAELSTTPPTPASRFTEIKSASMQRCRPCFHFAEISARPISSLRVALIHWQSGGGPSNTSSSSSLIDWIGDAVLTYRMLKNTTLAVIASQSIATKRRGLVIQAGYH